MTQRKLRMGMVGGGSTAFIGAIHRLAALMDNQIELVCGCFSSKPEVSLSSGLSYFLPKERCYASYAEMFEREALLPEGERMDFVSIVTPNKWHFEPAMMALERGFHVVLDKPMTFSLEEAHQLKAKVEETGLVFALTHTYSGYPAVKQARQMVADGSLGKLRRIYVEYPQGWLAELEEARGVTTAKWRTDPALTGKAGCIGDIGTHAWHLAEYISGQRVTELCAELSTFVEGRLNDDDGVALMHFDGGAKGVLMASQTATGEENTIKIRLYGEKGGLEWSQWECNTLKVTMHNQPTQIYRTGSGYMGDLAKWNTRTPGGHPEGYLEAFANIYRNFSLAVRAMMNGEVPSAAMLDFPSTEDGLRGMQFVETMVASGLDNTNKWTKWIIK